ncbi:hypothetical protein [Saccharothrix sp.]|uniref:hypothetical protein n=1 Tax=Saccharothrix sp. TaxID=1873460 RepID=UPI0028111915|nr:hypothetical protein [Saccharothrix sp.]
MAGTQASRPARRGPIPPNVEVLQRQLDDAHARNARLEADKKTLQGRIDTLAAIITELTYQAEYEKIITMPTRRRRSGVRTHGGR